MAEPSVQVPASLLRKVRAALHVEPLAWNTRQDIYRELDALLSQPEPSADQYLTKRLAEMRQTIGGHLMACLVNQPGNHACNCDAGPNDPPYTPSRIEDMAPGTRITGRSKVTGIWVQATVETGGTLIIGDTHWDASVLDPSSIRDVHPPAPIPDRLTLDAIRAAHTEYQNTGDLHELARAMNTLLST